jgi:hypothetical protein
MRLISFSLLLISLTFFRKGIVITKKPKILAFFKFAQITYFFILKKFSSNLLRIQICMQHDKWASWSAVYNVRPVTICTCNTMKVNMSLVVAWYSAYMKTFRIMNVNFGPQSAIGGTTLTPLANCTHYSLMIIILSPGKCFPVVFLMTIAQHPHICIAPEIIAIFFKHPSILTHQITTLR